MTKAFDTALFVPETAPAVDQVVDIDKVGPPFDTNWQYVAKANGPGVTVGGSIPQATAKEQTLMSVSGAGFPWVARPPYYLGALGTIPDTTVPPLDGTMFWHTPESTPYVWIKTAWIPLPIASFPRLHIDASLPAATLDGQMLIAGPRGNQDGRTVFPWQATYGYFLGAHQVPPTQIDGGSAIPIGSVYYNTSTNQLYVWTGSGWHSITVPAKATTASLYYTGAGGQTVFPLTTQDIFGNNHAFDTDTNEGVEVYVNGVRAVPNGGTVAGDYSVDYANSIITMTTGVSGTSTVLVDILVDPVSLAPTVALIEKLRPLVFDGITTTFALLLSTGAALAADDPADLHVVLDGVEQNPGVDYVLTTDGQGIVFATAPQTDVVSWIIFYAKTKNTVLPSFPGGKKSVVMTTDGLGGVSWQTPALRFFDSTANYVIGDLVAYNGLVYSSRTVHAPGAFDNRDWLQVTKMMALSSMTFYVSATGNDATGAGTAAAPWATIGRAAEWFTSSFDANGKTILLAIGAGTFVGARFNNFNCGSFLISGVGISQTIITQTSFDPCFGFFIDPISYIVVSQMTLKSVDAVSAITSNAGIQISNLLFDLTLGGNVIAVYGSCELNPYSNLEVRGGGITNAGNKYSTIMLYDGAKLYDQGVWSITGTPNSYISWVSLQNNCYGLVDTATYTGAVTGAKFYLTTGSNFRSNSDSPSIDVLPGSTPGVMDTSSFYDGVQGTVAVLESFRPQSLRPRLEDLIQPEVV